MARRLIAIAAFYLVVGACLGQFMGMTTNFALAPVHAHLLLAGWVSLAVMGLIYQQFPQAATTRLAQLHFWLHNLGLPVFMTGLAMQRMGHVVPLLIPIGATALLVGLIAFALNLWLTFGRSARTAGEEPLP